MSARDPERSSPYAEDQQERRSPGEAPRGDISELSRDQQLQLEQQRRQEQQRAETLQEETAERVSSSEPADIAPGDVETVVRDGRIEGELTTDAQRRVASANLDEEVDVIDIGQDDIEYQMEDEDVVGAGLTIEAQTRATRQQAVDELDKEVPEIDVTPDDIRVETENGDAVGAGLTLEAQTRATRRRAAEDLDQQVPEIEVTSDDVRVETEDGEVVGAELTESAQESAARNRAAEQFENEVGLDVDASPDDFVVDSGEVRPSEDLQQEAEQEAERQARREAREEAEEQFEQETGIEADWYDFTIEDGEVRPSENLMDELEEQSRAEAQQQAAEDFEAETGIDADPSDFVIEDGVVRPSEDIQREAASEAVSEDILRERIADEEGVPVENVSVDRSGDQFEAEVEREYLGGVLDPIYDVSEPVIDTIVDATIGDTIDIAQFVVDEFVDQAESVSGREVEEFVGPISEYTQQVSNEFALDELVSEEEVRRGDVAETIGTEVQAGDFDVDSDTGVVRASDDLQQRVAAANLDARTQVDVEPGQIQMGDDGPQPTAPVQRQIAAERVSRTTGVEATAEEIVIDDETGSPRPSGDLREELAIESAVNPDQGRFIEAADEALPFYDPSPDYDREDIAGVDFSGESPTIDFTEEYEAEQIAEQVASENPDVAMEDVVVTSSDGSSESGFDVGLTEEAQRERAREQIAEQEDVDPTDVEIVDQDDGQFEAEIDQDSPNPMQTAREEVSTLIGEASDPGDVVEAVGAVGSDVVDRELENFHVDPRDVDGPVEYGSELTEAYQEDVIDTENISVRDPLGTAVEVESRVSEDLNEIEPTTREQQFDALETIGTAPISATTTAWGGVTAAAHDPQETAETVGTAPFRVQTEAVRVGAEAAEFGSEVLTEIDDSVVPQTVAAGAPIAAAEPTPAGEAVVGGAAVIGGAAVAGSVAADRYGLEGDQTPTTTATTTVSEIDAPSERVEWGQAEIDVPAEQEATPSEIETPAETDTEFREISVPESLQGSESELEISVPEQMDGSEVSIEDGRIQLPAEAALAYAEQRAQEEEDEEDEEDEEEEDEEIIQEEEPLVPEEMIPEETVVIGQEVSEEESVLEDVEEEAGDEIVILDEIQGVDDAEPDQTEADEEFVDQPEPISIDEPAETVDSEVESVTEPLETADAGSGADPEMPVGAVADDQQPDVVDDEPAFEVVEDAPTFEIVEDDPSVQVESDGIEQDLEEVQTQTIEGQPATASESVASQVDAQIESTLASVSETDAQLDQEIEAGQTAQLQSQQTLEAQLEQELAATATASTADLEAALEATAVTDAQLDDALEDTFAESSGQGLETGYGTGTGTGTPRRPRRPPMPDLEGDLAQIEDNLVGWEQERIERQLPDPVGGVDAPDDEIDSELDSLDEELDELDNLEGFDAW